jgi:hypothetical protein
MIRDAMDDYSRRWIIKYFLQDFLWRMKFGPSLDLKSKRQSPTIILL